MQFKTKIILYYSQYIHSKRPKQQNVIKNEYFTLVLLIFQTLKNIHLETVHFPFAGGRVPNLRGGAQEFCIRFKWGYKNSVSTNSSNTLNFQLKYISRYIMPLYFLVVQKVCIGLREAQEFCIGFRRGHRNFSSGLGGIGILHPVQGKKEFYTPKICFGTTPADRK